MIYAIIITILINSLVAANVSLTYSHCPSDFNITTSNSSLQSASNSLANSIYSQILSPSDQKQITQAIYKGQYSKMISKITSTSFLLPFYLVMGIFGGLFLLSICCCLFDRRCPPCQSWRRNYVKDPYSKLQLRCITLIASLFSIGILIATVVAFSSFSLFRNDLQMVQCSAFSLIDIATNGQQSNKWGGMGQIQSQVNNITSLIASASTIIQSTLMGNEWIQTGLNLLQNMNIALWSNNNNSKVLSPEPIATYNAMIGGTALPQVKPYFIEFGLGPNGTSGTMISDIDAGLRTVSKQAMETYKSAQILVTSSSNINTNVNNNLKTINITTTSLGSFQSNLEIVADQYVKIGKTWGLYGIEAIFAVILLAALLSVLGLIGTSLFGLLPCKRMVGLGWVMFGLTYFTICVVLIIFLGMGGASYTICGVFQKIFANNTAFTQFVNTPSSSPLNRLFEYVEVCFFGDGNILKTFKIGDQMETVANLFENIELFSTMQLTSSPQYVDINTASTKLLNWMNVMNKYLSGVYKDAASSLNDQRNPQIAIIGFTNLTNQMLGAVSSLCSNDTWVFDNQNCTFAATQSVYTSSTAANGLYFPPTGTLCLSLNTRIASNSPSLWTAGDIIQRYKQLRTCKTGASGAFDSLVKYANSLTNYRDSRINLYQNLYDQLNAILGKSNEYTGNMSSFKAALSSFQSSVSSLNNLVTNKINGLIVSNNCSCIADQFRFLHNMYCVNFISRTVKIVVACMALLILMVGSVIAGSFFALRFDRLQKLQKSGQQQEIAIFSKDNMMDEDEDDSLSD